MKIAWVTDSTAHLNEELKNHPDVFTIPMTILFENDEYEDGVNIGPEEFYEKLRNSNTIPKTSQPSIGKFVDLYKRLQNDYDKVISVHVSSDLSGTVSSALQATELVDISVEVIDSRILSFPMAVLLREGMKMHADGKSVDEIIGSLKEMTKKNETYVLIGSLEQLHRSGRMNTAQYYLGSMLQVKPIISLSDGKLSVVERVRSEKKATAKILEILESSLEKSLVKEVYVLFGLRDDKAIQWKEKIESKFPSLKVYTYPLGTTIGVHAGENTIGLSWFTE
ncbi:DegV family protein [Bacillus timonensis]|nr:DegV family protein [Bacillus timonensis]